MIPGSITRLVESTVASATSIAVKTDVVVVTGSTQIDTIAPAGTVGQGVILIPKDGAVILGATGNIAVGITMAINRAVHLTFVKSLGKWYINSGV